MKKIRILCVLLVSIMIITSCGVSNKTILRYQKLEEGVQNPTTVEELLYGFTVYLFSPSVTIG